MEVFASIATIVLLIYSLGTFDLYKGYHNTDADRVKRGQSLINLTLIFHVLFFVGLFFLSLNLLNEFMYIFFILWASLILNFHLYWDFKLREAVNDEEGIRWTGLSPGIINGIILPLSFLFIYIIRPLSL